MTLREEEKEREREREGERGGLRADEMCIFTSLVSRGDLVRFALCKHATCACPALPAAIRVRNHAHTHLTLPRPGSDREKGGKHP